MLSVTEQNNFVLVDRPRPNVALVTLNRPERMNSMAFDVMVPLKKVLEELTYDNEARVIVLTGVGRGSRPVPTTSRRARCPTSTG